MEEEIVNKITESLEKINERLDSLEKIKEIPEKEAPEEKPEPIEEKKLERKEMLKHVATEKQDEIVEKTLSLSELQMLSLGGKI